MVAHRTSRNSTAYPSGSDEIPYVDEASDTIAALFRWIAEPLTGVSGSNTITASVDGTIVDAPAALNDGKLVSWTQGTTNTGAVTLNVNSLGAVDVRRIDGTALQAGDLVAGTLYVAIRAGSQWRVLTALGSLYQTTAVATAPDLIVRDEKTAGTAGGTSGAAGSFQTVTLNTSVRNAITGASLASNQVTLPAGTYFAVWRVPGYGVDDFTSKLRNVSDSTDADVGTPASSVVAAANTVSGPYANSFSHGSAYFTIAAAKTFEVQRRVATLNGTTGAGKAANLGVKEVYAELLVWKMPVNTPASLAPFYAPLHALLGGL